MSTRVAIDASEWRPVVKDRSWLKTDLILNGVSLHLDAVEVGSERFVQDGRGELRKAFEMLHDAVGADGPWSTLRIEGRDYVLIATPFS